MDITESTKLEISNNWLRIVAYFLMVFLVAIIVFIPIVILVQTVGEWENFQSKNHYTWINILINIGTCATVLFATYLMIEKIEHQKKESYLMTISTKDSLFGFISGATIMCVFVIASLLLGVIHFSLHEISNQILFDFAFFFLVAVTEEVMFRGYVLTNLREKFNNTNALILSSILFGAVHYWNDHFTLIGFMSIALSGFVMGWLTIKSGTISVAVGMHWSWNFFQGPVFGFPVSGNKVNSLFATDLISSPMITGGAFGAEGSVLLVFIIVLFILLFIKNEKFFLKRRLESTTIKVPSEQTID